MLEKIRLKLEEKHIPITEISELIELLMEAERIVTRTRVLLADNLHPFAKEILEGLGPFQVISGLDTEGNEREIEKVGAVVVRSGFKLTEEIIEKAKELRLVIRAGVGWDNIDADASKKHGIIVETTPEGSTESVAQQTMARIMVIAYRIYEISRKMKTAKNKGKTFENIRKDPAIEELTGKKLGLIGRGRIGSRVKELAEALNMEVIFYDPAYQGEKGYVELQELLESSDYISIHLPLADSTRGLIGEREIAMMKDGVNIINFARGGIIDEKDLLEELNREGCRINMVALDVFTSEKISKGEGESDLPEEIKGLIKHEKVLASPHIGASTEQAQTNCAVDVVIQLLKYFVRAEVVDRVNIDNPANRKRSPERQENRYRLIIAHNNVPGRIHEITGVLYDPEKGRNINVEEAGPVARKEGDGKVSIYTLDFDFPDGWQGPSLKEIIKEIESLDNILWVQVIERKMEE